MGFLTRLLAGLTAAAAVPATETTVKATASWEMRLCIFMIMSLLV